MEGIFSSMAVTPIETDADADPARGTVTTSLLTAVAPIAWGSTYYVTQAFLPADKPLFGAVLRALPIGLLIVLATRQLPKGIWWWRAFALGNLTIGTFFVLVYVAAQRLPGGVAATLMATSPAVMMLLAWPMVGERPRLLGLAGAAIGFVGVGLLVLGDQTGLDAVGVLASLAAMLLSSMGFLLTKRWRPPVSLLTLNGWQLVTGGLTVLPVAWWLEGSPPPLDLPTTAAFAYLAIVATGLAYVVWFHGLQRLEAGTVALIGLLNPVTGAVVGAVLADERFGPLQLVGMALVLTGVLAGQPAIRARLGNVLRPGRSTPGTGAQDAAPAPGDDGTHAAATDDGLVGRRPGRP